jgi:hypothetical protein
MGELIRPAGDGMGPSTDSVGAGRCSEAVDCESLSEEFHPIV